jgi:hypothetical protein
VPKTTRIARASWCGRQTPRIARAAFFVVAVAAYFTAACDAPAPACPGGLDPERLAGLWAARTELLSADVLALRIDAGSARGELDVAVGGIPATARANGELELEYTDAVGRSVSLVGCSDVAHGALGGSIERCAGERCELARFEAEKIELDEPIADDVELLSEFRGNWDEGRTSDLAVAGGVAYVARGPDGLRVLDVSAAEQGDVAELFHVAAPVGDDWNDVALLDGGWALVASLRSGLLVYDVRELPPVLVADGVPAPVSRNGHNVFVAAGRAYLARTGSGGGLDVIDVADPEHPRALGHFALDGAFQAHDVYVEGDIAYVSSLEDGLVVLDVADAERPELVARARIPASHSAYPVETDRGRAVLVATETYAGHLHVLHGDVDAEDFLAPWSEYAAGSPVSAHKLACAGTRCFVAYYQHGLRVVDFATPDEPVAAGHYDTHDGPGETFLEGASGVVVEGDIAYVVDTVRGLLVLRVED